MSVVDKAKLYLIQRTSWLKKIEESEEGKQLAKSENNLLKLVKETAKTNDIKEIVTLEKTILEHTYTEHTNSAAMGSSFSNGINDMDLILKNLEKVDDFEKYQEVNDAIQAPKKRKGDLPLDDARTGFMAHFQRLTNQDKTHLSDNEKKLIDVRRSSLNLAHKLYREKQAKTLGIDLSQSQKKSRSR